MQTISATYDPADDKIRLSCLHRLDQETYERVKAAGYAWAPKQEVFYAVWSPSREDLALELAGEIGDEDTTLVERAEQRAERFEEYSDRRAEDANAAKAAVDRIADGIPLGQPILVGHHSERRARKDAEKIENGMRRAVRMWETSQYWISRAKGAIRAAKYKERPDVRARRIKGLEADKRKQERTREQAETYLKLWSKDGLTWEQARVIANHDYASRCYPLSEFPRELPKSQYEGMMGMWSALEFLTVEQAKAICIPAHQGTIAHCDRWIQHYDNRLAYERAMLADQGGTEDGRPKAAAFDIQVGGKVLVGRDWYTVTKVNRKDGQTVSVSTNSRYGRVKGIEEIADYEAPTTEQVERVKAASKLPPLVNFRAEGCIEMTTEQWKQKQKYGCSASVTEFNAQGTRAKSGMIGEGVAAYRQRSVLGRNWETIPVFLTDAKESKPPTEAPEKPTLPPVQAAITTSTTRDTRKAGNLESIHEAMFYKYESGKLKAGIKYEYSGEGWAECYQYSTVQDLIEAARACEAQPQLLRYKIVTHSGEYKNMATVYEWERDAETFKALRESLQNGGVKVVSAPQLFPTPADLARRMVDEAGVQPGHRVLEPSAGTGAIVKALDDVPGAEVVAVEISHTLADNLRLRSNTKHSIVCSDFLACNGDLGKFDRILMNPPFENGSDIKHIEHAMGFLKPGGRLVAICANGPRQQARLKPLAEQSGGYYEELPAGTFANQGTGVNTALVCIEAEE